MDNVLSLANLSSFSPGRIQDLYIKFLGNFPLEYQPMVSLVVGIFIVYTIYRVIRRDFIFILALLVLVPASVPVLKSIWSGLLQVLKYLFNF
ncbi:MAG: hypothetical protein WAX44_00265 [Minisyncoccia bacterium]